MKHKASFRVDAERLVARHRFLLPRREAARIIIERGIETGEFDKKLDPELAMDILYGSIYYRLLIGHLPQT